MQTLFDFTNLWIRQNYFQCKIGSLSHAINKAQVILNRQDCFKFLCFPKSWGEALSMVLWWERLSLWCWAAADEWKAVLHNWPSVCVWRRNSVVFMRPEALSRFSRRRKGEVHPSKLLWYCTEKALTVASPIGTLAYCVPPHVAR